MIAVVDAAQAAALDRFTIEAGVPSRALMQRAGAAAAAVIANRYASELHRGVVVCAGPGNNGGDGWVVARALAASGVAVTVVEPAPARTPDCMAERALAAPVVTRIVEQLDSNAGAGIVVDALLGTGTTGAVREPFAAVVTSMAAIRSRGAAVVALDLPSGLDATTGEATGAVTADCTVTFGAIKRGLLLDRARAGAIVVVDIGFLENRAPAATLVTGAWVRERTPAIGAGAHKGTRGTVVVVGGGEGMAGAAILAVRGALRSGAGLARALVHESSVAAVQRAEPAAITTAWREDIETALDRADAIVVGPGLGRSDAAVEILEACLASRLPVVLDADALNHFAGRLSALRASLDTRAAVLTPHPAELGRLVGCETQEVLADRFAIGGRAARAAGATVLLKGAPTIITDGTDAPRLVVARGTPALATGGAGDVLSGIIGALVAHAEPATAAAIGAWIHGRAAEIAGDGAVRGVALDDVVESLRTAWTGPVASPTYPILEELPPVPAA